MSIRKQLIEQHHQQSRQYFQQQSNKISLRQQEQNQRKPPNHSEFSIHGNKKGRQQQWQMKRQGTPVVCSTQQLQRQLSQHHHLSEEEELLKLTEINDYNLYKNVKINDFFNKPYTIKDKPTTVSEICLLNDHYIFVKMPQAPSNDLELTKSRKDCRKSPRTLKYSKQKSMMSKITPIPEEESYDFRTLNAKEEVNVTTETMSKNQNKMTKLNCLPVRSCWQSTDIIEVHPSRTKICRNLVLKSNEPMEDTTKQQLSVENKQQQFHDQLKSDQEIPTVSGSLTKSSLQNRVSIKHIGNLVESNEANNNSEEVLKKSDFKRRNKHWPSPHAFPKSLYFWLMQPFRRKYRKPKQKIQAVVYKTYFVKWIKPPDTLTHGFGVKPTKSNELQPSVLRRCRSAIF